jgi:hypothetical protein
MANATVSELRKTTDAAWDNLSRQLQGMEPHIERSDAPGEWTTRQVLCHLLFSPGWNPVTTLKSFSFENLPEIEIVPGQCDVTPERQKMTLSQLKDALDAQRREMFGYLETLSDADLQRKARIPLFKRVMNTEEVPIPAYVGAMFGYHWKDHAGQLAKIRKAAGLPDAK